MPSLYAMLIIAGLWAPFIAGFRRGLWKWAEITKIITTGSKIAVIKLVTAGSVDDSTHPENSNF